MSLGVDALDEVDEAALSAGANLSYLPMALPPRVYIVVSTRKIPIGLRIDSEQVTLDIEHDSAGNISDIREYVQQSLGRQEIKDYIISQNITPQSFVDLLTMKSEGNFMYLHYVLPEIEAGAYKDTRLDAIPVGLQNYYEDHWRRMRGRDETGWFEYKLPIIMALTVVNEPVSIDLIADFAEVPQKSRIRTVLQEWEQFLHIENVEYEGAQQRRYSMYHASFHDFIAKKEEVADERVSRKDAHRKIADKLMTDIFPEETTF